MIWLKPSHCICRCPRGLCSRQFINQFSIEFVRFKDGGRVSKVKALAQVMAVRHQGMEKPCSTKPHEAARKGAMLRAASCGFVDISFRLCGPKNLSPALAK